MTDDPLGHIRQRMLRRFRESIDSHPGGGAPVMDLPATPESTPPPLKTLLVRRPPTHDFAGEAKRLEEEAGQLGTSLRDTQERQRKLQQELEAARESAARSDIRAQKLFASLEAAIGKYDAAQQEVVALRGRLEAAQADLERFASARTILEENDRELLAARSRAERLEKEVEGLRGAAALVVQKDRELADLQARHERLHAEMEVLRTRGARSAGELEESQRELERRLQERTELAREKARAADEMQKRLTDSEGHRREADEAQEALRAALQKKETELRLLTEDNQRLVRQSKEFASRLQERMNQGASVEPAAAAAGPAAGSDSPWRERLHEMEAVLESRDKMLARNAEALAEKSALLEELQKEATALKSRAAAGTADPAAAELQSRLEARERDLEDLRRREQSLREQLAKPGPSSGGADAGDLKAAVAEAESLRRACADLKIRNEELETEIRLLVMNSESIEKLEKSLRESFRLLVRPVAASAPVAAVRPAAPPPGPWERFKAWWSSRASKSAAPPPAPRSPSVPAAAPANAQRLRRR
jgi:chromosome segregation ATPase